jgi:Transcriptional antiterminator
MNGRVYELLRYLLKNGNSTFTIESLSEKFAVGDRTIRNYLAVIEEFLLENNMTDLITVKTGNIVVDRSSDQADYVLDLAIKEDFYEYKLSPKERKFIITFSLLLTDGPITVSKMNELLYVSRATLLKDIAEVENYFHQNGIEFYENRHRGFLPKLTESQRRDAIISLVKDVSMPIMDLFDENTFNICSKIIRHRLKLEDYYPKAEEAVMFAEQIFNFSMTDNEFYETVLVLCISIARTCGEKMIESAFTGNPGATNCIQVAKYLLNRVGLDSQKNSTEELYLAEKLNGCTIKKTVGDVPDNYYFIVKSFLNKLAYVYKKEISRDYQLQELLTSHIAGICNRIKKGERIVNPLKNQIIEKYSADFDIINKNIWVIQDYIHIALNDDEKCFILVHVLAAVERLKQKVNMPKVIIVCNSGLGTSVFLSEMVKKHFNVNITHILSYHDLKKELLIAKNKRNLECDLIISTIPLKDMPLPWIQVGAMLSGEDLSGIQKMLSKVTAESAVNDGAAPQLDEGSENSVEEGRPVDTGSEKRKGIMVGTHRAVPLSNWFFPWNIVFEEKATDWKDALAIAARPLVQKKIVTENYVHSMIKNVMNHGPYIVFAPGVAVAHANSTDGVLDFGISILVLSEPVRFGHKDNDPVDIVAVVSLDNAKERKALLFCLMNILCNQSAVKEMRSAATSLEIIDVIKKYEARYAKSNEGES